MGEGTRIALCGQLRLELRGEPREAALRGRQGRLLFAYLALHRGRPVRRDELVEALWAGNGAPPSDTALAPVLSRLRGTLAPGSIEGRDQLTLVLPEPVWIDVEAATAALERARAALRAPDLAAAAAAAREAAALAEPGLLPGFEAPWLEGPRADLQDLRVEALEVAAEAGLGLGGPELPVAEADARAAVAASPYRESARAVLIRVLQARGNVAEALLAFEDVRRLLREELGTAPGPELLALHEQLLHPQASAVAAAAPVPVAPAAPQAPIAPSVVLVEREHELAELERLLALAHTGEGRLAYVEGPAGIGKTGLLLALRDRAEAAQVLVLEARAGVLERENGFGVVRQLCSPFAGRVDLFDASTAAARPVITDVAGETQEGDRSFAALHALYLLTLKVAAEQRPLVVLIDDLQWSDAPTLRFVAYLARRLADLPVLIAVSVRSGEPATDESLLAEIAADAVTVPLRPVALSPSATATLVRARLGEEADDTFAQACHEITGGNPLLVRQLLAALADEGVTPDAAHAAEVRAIGPRAVSRTVLLRLARLPADAVALARAVAVLGEQSGLPAAAALAEIDEAQAAEAVGVLAASEILRPDEPLGFVHPLVRDAVYGELPAARRALEHGRAARVLADAGAGSDLIATQLLAAPPRGDAWVVARLREAAQIALNRGAPGSAIAYLERARSEPPSAQERAAVALQLGEAAQYVSGPSSAKPLREALEGLTDPVERAVAAIRLGRVLYFLGTPDEAVALAARTAADLPAEEEDLHDALEAIQVLGVFFGALGHEHLARLDRVRYGGHGSGAGALALTSLTGLSIAVGAGPSAEASRLAREALEGHTLLREDPGVFSAGAAQALALGEPAEGAVAWERIGAWAREHRSGLTLVGADLWGGLTQIWTGDLAAAEASEERAIEGEILWGTTMAAEMGYSSSFLALARLEQGDLAGARAALERNEASTGTSDGSRFWRASNAELLLAEGRWDEAIRVTEDVERTWPSQLHPVWAPWRSQRARSLAALGDREQAVSLAREELKLARMTGARWVIGRGLRIIGEVAGADGIAHLEEAVALLAGCSARLEHAKALAALGRALAAAGRDAEAAPVLAEACELAERCGAAGLARDLASPLVD